MGAGGKGVSRGCCKGEEGFLPQLGCALWYILFPVVLVYHSFRIYLLPCILSYAIGACGACWLAIGRVCCCCFKPFRCCRRIGCCICLRYEDTRSFPSSAKSIGKWNGKSETEVEKAIEWKRGNEVCELADGEHMRLFSGPIEPSDIGQGQLGDCWLMTSLACLSEVDGAIQNVFLTDEYNERGRYVLQMYCGLTKKFEEIVVDDMIPVDRGTTTPIFAQPHGKELWVALLEKAFAKFLGDYAKLDGGYMLYGLQVLTGDEVSNWTLDAAGWHQHEIRYKSKHEIGFYRVQPPQVQDPDAFFKSLIKWDKATCVIAASTSGTDEGESTASQGLVQGHAYSVLSVVEVGKFRMLRLRNPWGKFEWTGDWSDSSPLWKSNPKVQNKCPGGGIDEDDGCFWMEYSDFKTHFQNVDVCHRSRGIHDIRLNINEDAGCIGPTKGCFAGCASYYCCCKGICRLCCPTDNRHGQVSAEP